MLGWLRKEPCVSLCLQMPGPGCGRVLIPLWSQQEKSIAVGTIPPDPLSNHTQTIIIPVAPALATLRLLGFVPSEVLLLPAPFPNCVPALNPPEGLDVLWEGTKRGWTAASVHHSTDSCLPAASNNKNPCSPSCCLTRELFQALPAMGSFLYFPGDVYSWTAIIISSLASTILSTKISSAGVCLLKTTTGCSQIPGEHLFPQEQQPPALGVSVVSAWITPGFISGVFPAAVVSAPSPTDE